MSIDFLDSELPVFYDFDLLMLRARDEQDVKSIFMQHLNHKGVRIHVQKKYPHLLGYLDKLLILK